MVHQSLFEVVFRCNRLGVSIDKLEREVADDPHERREVLGVLLWVGVVVAAARLNLDVLREVNDQAQVVQLRLIYRLLAVIDEIRGEENGERKDSHIVVLLLICGAQSLRVQDEHLDRVAIRREAVHRLAPNPNSLYKIKGRVSGQCSHIYTALRR